jgi:hypothetical protein
MFHLTTQIFQSRGVSALANPLKRGFVGEFSTVDRPIATSPKNISEAIEITSIGRSHGRLTGPIFLRAVDQLHSLEFRSARSKDWPVNQQACMKSVGHNC